jgi:hypothetical protein
MKQAPDPLADFPDWAWATLAQYTDLSIAQARSQLKLFLAALGAIGYQLHPAPEPDWDKMSEVVGTVLGDVASDREMDVIISSEQEVDLVVQAVREVLSGRA